MSINSLRIGVQTRQRCCFKQDGARILTERGLSVPPNISFLSRTGRSIRRRTSYFPQKDVLQNLQRKKQQQLESQITLQKTN